MVNSGSHANPWEETSYIRLPDEPDNSQEDSADLIEEAGTILHDRHIQEGINRPVELLDLRSPITC